MKGKITMKKILSVFISVCLAGVFSSCSDFESSPAVETSTVETLSELENEVFEALKIALLDFRSPTEARVLEAGDYLSKSSTDEFPSGLEIILLKISAPNGFGGNTSKYYNLYLNDTTFISNKGTELYFKKGDILEYTDGEITIDCDVDTSKLNKALKEYWEEQGLD